MRAKALLLVLIATGCGVVASIGVSQLVNPPGQQAQREAHREKIYVALADIDIGQKLGEDNVRLEAWYADNIPPGAVRRLEDLQEKFTQQRFYQGEPIIAAKLTDTAGTATVKIPEGFRAVPIKVSTESGGLSLITPGDHVDVMAFFRKGPDIATSVARTFLRDIRVFSVGEATERYGERDGKSAQTQTVSLLLRPKQAEAVLLAQELGRLQISLRRPDDPREEEVDDGDGLATLHEVLQGVSELTRRPTNEPTYTTTVPAGPATPTAEQTPSVAGANSPAPPIAAQAQEEGWVMTVHTPEGVKILRWRRPNEMPVEVRPTQPGTPPAAAPSDVDSPRNSDAPAAGSRIDVTGTPTDGGPFAWSNYRGRPVLVAFWATWSPLSREELLLARQLHDNYRERGLDMIGIAVDDRAETVSSFVRDHRLTWTNLVGVTSHDAAQRYGVRQLPTLLLVGSDGRLVGSGSRVAEIAPQIARQFSVGAARQASNAKPATRNADAKVGVRSVNLTSSEATR